MKTSTPSRILSMVLACLLLATSFVIGSAALTTDSADAAPNCTSLQLGGELCFEPLAPTVWCLSPYVANGARCVAYNPHTTVATQTAWDCPQAPFLAQVTSDLILAPGYAYTYSCSYTPAANPYIPFPTYTFWA